MAQSGNPAGELCCVSDIPTEKYEDSRGLRSDGVGLRMTESEKYKLGFSVKAFNRSFVYKCSVFITVNDGGMRTSATVKNHKPRPDWWWWVKWAWPEGFWLTVFLGYIKSPVMCSGDGDLAIKPGYLPPGLPVRFGRR